MIKSKKLYRSRKDYMVGGVASGLADYLSLDPTVVRLLWLLPVFLAGSGILLYIVAWIIVPAEPEQEGNTGGSDATDIFHRGEELREHIVGVTKKSQGGGTFTDGGSSAGSSFANSDRRSHDRRLGWILIGVGLFFALRHLFRWISFDTLWPLLIVVGGVYFLLRAGRR